MVNGYLVQWTSEVVAHLLPVEAVEELGELKVLGGLGRAADAASVEHTLDGGEEVVDRDAESLSE
eukprot:5855402-Lingulodinium_polyedra.AAC.1